MPYDPSLHSDPLPPPPYGHTVETWARALALRAAEHCDLSRRYAMRSPLRTATLNPLLDHLYRGECNALAAAHMLDSLTMRRS